jgi:translation initiation factor 1
VVKYGMPKIEASKTVYTTESGRICPKCGQPVSQCRCKKAPTPAPAGDGVIRVGLEKKGRGGKTVSIISGLPGNEATLQALLTECKRRCGSGGTIKNGVIEIQGDHRDLLIEILTGKGFKPKRVGG